MPAQSPAAVLPRPRLNVLGLIAAGRRLAGLPVAGCALMAGCTATADPGQVREGTAGIPATAPPTATAPAGRTFPAGTDAAAVAFEVGGRRVAVGTREAVVILDTAGGAATAVPTIAGVRRIVALPGGGFRALAGDTVLTLPPDSAGPPSAGPLDRSSSPAAGPSAAPGSPAGPDSAGRAETWRLPAAGADLVVLADGATAVAVADRRQVVVLDPAGATVRTLTVPGTPTGLAVAGGTGPDAVPRLGVVDSGRSSLYVYRADTGEQEEALRAGDGASTAIGDGTGRIIVADTRDGEILIFSTDPLVLRQRHPAAGAPYATAYDPLRRRLWVTLTARNELVGYDVTGGAPREVARHPTVRQPDGVAVDPTSGAVAVTGRVEGLVQLIIP